MLPVAARYAIHPRRSLRARQPYAALAVVLACCAGASCSAPPEPVPLDDDNDVPTFMGTLPTPGPGAPAPPAVAGPQAAPAGSNATGNAGAAPSASPEQNPASGAPIAGANGNMGGAGGASMVAGNDVDQGVGGSAMGLAGSTGMQPATPQDQPPVDQGQPDQPPVDQGQPDPPPADQGQPDQPPVDQGQPDPPPVDPAQPDPPPVDQAQPEQSPPAPNQPPAVAPAAPDIPCPADATFCSGFEGTALPDGSTFVIGGDASFANQFALDGTVARSGQQSFSIPGPSPGFSYRALTVPAPGQDFWARLYVQVDSEFGDANHDALFGASNGDQQSDHNNETLIELSEQFGYMLLNTDDCALECNTPSPQLTLAPGAWHCLEAHYDAVNQHVEVFLAGERFIDSQRPEYNFTYQTFRLGYMRFNTERTVHYDDVVVARSRVGCE